MNNNIYYRQTASNTIGLKPISVYTGPDSCCASDLRSGLVANARKVLLTDPVESAYREPSRTLRQQVWSYVSRSPLRSLWNLEGVPARVIVKNTWNAMFADNLLGRSAELGFYFIFALFPTLVTACSILGLAARSAVHIYENLLQYLSIVVPPSALGTVLEAFNQTTAAASSGKLTFGLVAALWSASVGFSAIQESLNVVYRVKESRPYWKATIVGDRRHVHSLHRHHPHARVAAGGRLPCPPRSPSYLSSLSGCMCRSLAEDCGMAHCHSVSFLAFRTDLLLRAGRQGKPLALAYAWLRPWHAGLARGLAWAFACTFTTSTTTRLPMDRWAPSSSC